jgi:hypothetical protein
VLPSRSRLDDNVGLHPDAGFVTTKMVLEYAELMDIPDMASRVSSAVVKKSHTRRDISRVLLWKSK